jgi:hypothetical protein
MTARKRPISLGERRKRVGASKLPVVRPMWPLLAMMFAGVWIAWPWFLLNEALMKSDDLRRQAKVVVIGLLVAAGIAATIISMVEVELLSIREARYVAMLLMAWKLGVSYVLESRQRKGFGLWGYFGGEPRNGLYVFIAATYLSGVIFERLPFGVLWLVLR